MKEQGVVKWFNGAKGYGFIQRSTGEDVFVHFSAIQENGYKTLNEGESVEFECQQGPKGLNAAYVLRVSLAFLRAAFWGKAAASSLTVRSTNRNHRQLFEAARGPTRQPCAGLRQLRRAMS